MGLLRTLTPAASAKQMVELKKMRSATMNPSVVHRRNLFSLGLLQRNNSFAFSSPYVSGTCYTKGKERCCRCFSEGRLSRGKGSLGLPGRGNGACTKSSGERVATKRAGRKLMVVQERRVLLLP